MLLSRCGRGVGPGQGASTYISLCDAFVGGDHELACIKQWCEMLVLKLLCFRYYYFIWNLGCNNFNRTLMYGNVFELYVTCGMYVESCMILVVCW